MSTAPVDYTALAAQARGATDTPKAVDYGALAEQARTVSEEDHTGLFDRVKKGASDYFGNIIQQMHQDNEALKQNPQLLVERAKPYARSAEMAVPAQGLVDVAKAGINAIPKVAEVGKLFGQVEDAAAQAGVRIQPSQRMAELASRAQELKTNAGSTIPPPMRTFMRNTIPSRMNPGPVEAPSFGAARDAYSSATNLSATDKMNLGGKMPGVFKAWTKELDTQLRAAADSIGQGDTYAEAMKKYPIAAKLDALKDMAPDMLAKIAKYGAIGLGAGVLGRLGYAIFREF